MSTCHSLSQQGIWASFVHPNPHKSPLRTPTHFGEYFFRMSILSIKLNNFYLNIIPMTLCKDLMPNFNKKKDVCGCYLSKLGCTLKYWTLKKNCKKFSKSWLRPWHMHLYNTFYLTKNNLTAYFLKEHLGLSLIKNVSLNCIKKTC